MDDARREFLVKILRENHGCVALAARAYGFNRTDLLKKVKVLLPEFKNTPMPAEHRRSKSLGGPHRAWGGNAAWKALDGPTAHQ